MATLIGIASKAAHIIASASGGLVPRFQTGPKSWVTSVVSPAASAASQTCGESRCTWQSMPPGVTTSPRASKTAVPVSSTTPMPSIVSGFPARPMDTMRPSLMPIDVARTPSTGSSTRPPTTATSTPPRSARTPKPSRMVLPQPAMISSGPETSSLSGATQRSLSPSLTAAGSGTLVAPLPRQRQRRFQRAGRVQGAVHQAAVSAHDAGAAERHHPHLAGLAGLDHDLHPGRHRQPHAPGRPAIEQQPPVGLEHVEVRGERDRDVGRVRELQRCAALQPLRLGVARVERRRPAGW